jgi:hypothetical protein
MRHRTRLVQAIGVLAGEEQRGEMVGEEANDGVQL